MGLVSRSRRPNGGDCEVAVEPAFREDREAELDTEMAAPHLRKNPNEHPAGDTADPSANGSRVEGKRLRRRESERLPLVGEGKRTEAEVFLDAAHKARGKVPGALPRNPARGTPPGTPGPFPSRLKIPERSSPSRVRSAAQNRRALDRSGPFRRVSLDEGKGAHAKAKTKTSADHDFP
jgi:hypothetical protein